MKTAIVLGASGLTGGLLLKRLLKDESYNLVKVFVRKSLGMNDPKLEEVVCDLLHLEDQADKFKGDEVYCCIGTTMKKTPDKKVYYKIDYGIPVAAAKLCTTNGINTLITVSALGANSKSSIFYNRTKGEMEQSVLAENIRNTYFMRPSFIGGDRQEKRKGEKIGIAIFKFLQPIMLGPLKKYRLIDADTIAKAMLILAEKGYEKAYVESNEIQKLAD
jgi:uncharacterized protein YbjT (DUF2867 family)|tara:strand:+ start:20303 stop:20956 length:654 start_codon:yes stop_codon:yes gene_type:complete